MTDSTPQKQDKATGAASELNAGLERCPFCGSREMVHTSNGHENEYIECTECGCSGPSGVDKEDAILFWNKRPND